MTVEELLLILLEAPRDYEIVVQTVQYYGCCSPGTREDSYPTKVEISDQEVKLS